MGASIHSQRHHHRRRLSRCHTFITLASLCLTILFTSAPCFTHAEPQSNSGSPSASASPSSDLRPLRVPVPKVDTAEFHDLLSQAHKRPILVQFMAPWCGYCRQMKPAYEAAAKAMLSQPAPTQLIQVDCMDERALCMRFGVTSFPQIRLLRLMDGVDVATATAEYPSSAAAGSFAPSLRLYSFHAPRTTLSFITFVNKGWKDVHPHHVPPADPSDLHDAAEQRKRRPKDDHANHHGAAVATQHDQQDGENKGQAMDDGAVEQPADVQQQQQQQQQPHATIHENIHAPDHSAAHVSHPLTPPSNLAHNVVATTVSSTSSCSWTWRLMLLLMGATIGIGITRILPSILRRPALKASSTAGLLGHFNTNGTTHKHV